jgi:outer membrane receptor for ferrienterochelin and colicins
VPAPSTTLLNAYLIRALSAGLELALNVDNLSNLRLADESLLFQQAEAPRTWRLALRGRW